MVASKQAWRAPRRRAQCRQPDAGDAPSNAGSVRLPRARRQFDFRPTSQTISENLEDPDMGGFGSGRPGWKQKAEQFRSLDVNKHRRADCLTPGYRGGWRW